MTVHARRRVVALAAALLAVAGAVVLAVVALGGPSPPGDRAAGLVPADALVYVHASTDPGRGQDERLLELLTRFQALGELRTRLERSLAPRAAAFDLRRDVRPWLGDEAAVAVERGGGALVLLAVEDEPRAQGVLLRLGREEAALPYRGTVVRRFSGSAAAFVRGFLVLGSEAGVKRAVDLAAGRGMPLSQRPDYARAAGERPDDRVLDAWLAPGAGAVLPGLPEAAGTLAPRPVLLTLAPADEGLRLTARALGLRLPEFAPELLGAAPEDAVAYLGLPTLEPLVDLLPRTGPEARRLLAALRPLVARLDREVAIWVLPGEPDPVVTLAARTSAPQDTRDALGRLQGVVAQLLTGSEDATGQVPTFEERDLGDGRTAFALRLAGGGELVTAVDGDRVAVSNAESGVRRALGAGPSLREAERFGATVTGVPDAAEALGFVDLSQLLALAERAGLITEPADERVRDDLRRLRALGVVVRRQGTDTTAELIFQIP